MFTSVVVTIVGSALLLTVLTAVLLLWDDYR